MKHCVFAQARRLRQLEKHQAWLRKHIPSKPIQQQRHVKLVTLRTELCLRLGCAGDAVDAQLELRRSKQ